MSHKKHILLAAAMAAALLCLIAGHAYGYFTANSHAEGTLVIAPLNVVPHETIAERGKQLALTNEENSAAAYVRARGFCGDDSALQYTAESGWTDGGDGWWYFDPVLEPGQSTSALKIDISAVLPENPKIGDSFNIVVVFESIRPEVGADGAKETFRAFLNRQGGEQS